VTVGSLVQWVRGLIPISGFVSFAKSTGSYRESFDPRPLVDQVSLKRRVNSPRPDDGDAMNLRMWFVLSAQLDRLANKVPADWTVYPGYGSSGGIAALTRSATTFIEIRAAIQSQLGPSGLTG
jgi:hypothetical protein